jgi:hypothetical protein
MRGRSAAAAVALLLSGAGPGGCSAEREVPVRILGGGPQCGGAGGGTSARRLVSSAEVGEALSRGLGAAPVLPPVNWGTEAVVLVSAGQRSSAGYGVELASQKAQVKEGEAALRVSFPSPPAGAMGAQVVTSPCLVVAMSRGELRAVAVLDGERVFSTVKLD